MAPVRQVIAWPLYGASVFRASPLVRDGPLKITAALAVEWLPSPTKYSEYWPQALKRWIVVGHMQ